MRSLRRKGTALVLAMGLTLSTGALAASPQEESSPSADAMVVDLLLVRPVMVATTVVGAALYVISLPFSLPGGNAAQAGQRLVVEPAQFTFSRPLGEFPR